MSATRYDKAPCGGCGSPMVPRGRPAIPAGYRPYGARGLCHSCSGRLYRPPPPAFRSGTWTRDDLLAEWDFLRRQGFTLRQATERLGVTHAALDQAINRGKRDGDARAVRQAA